MVHDMSHVALTEDRLADSESEAEDNANIAKAAVSRHFLILLTYSMYRGRIGPNHYTKIGGVKSRKADL